jgi:FkbM family methyltransferase
MKNEFNFYPRVIYDIGSQVLHWTRHAKNVWNDSDFYLFEAFEPAEMFYINTDFTYNIGLLSDVDNKEIKFYQNDLYPGGSSYYREIGSKHGDFFPEHRYLVKNSRSLDSIVNEKQYPYPDLVKIDVQGAELDVIKGALNVLSHTKYLIVELQFTDYNLNAPKVDITKPFIESLGWECIAEKFSDNGPDADYCFINNNIV